MKNELKYKIFVYLKIKIINNEIKPNEIINERDIASSFGTSTTPVKEALFYLEYYNFITIKPRKKIFVNEIDLKTIKDTFQMRVKLEPIIIDLTIKTHSKSFLAKSLLKFKNNFSELLELAEINETLFYKYDDEFHQFFSNNCGNQFFTNQMNLVYENLTRIRKILHHGIPKRKENIEEHINLLDLILDGEPYEKINSYSIEHIENEQTDFFKDINFFNL